MIIDPLNPTNNIGKSTYNFEMIQKEFAKAYAQILKLFNDFQTDKPCGGQVMWKKKLNILNKVLYGAEE